MYNSGMQLVKASACVYKIDSNGMQHNDPIYVSIRLIAVVCSIM